MLLKFHQFNESIDINRDDFIQILNIARDQDISAEKTLMTVVNSAPHLDINIKNNIKAEGFSHILVVDFLNQNDHPNFDGIVNEIFDRISGLSNWDEKILSDNYKHGTNKKCIRVAFVIYADVIEIDISGNIYFIIEEVMANAPEGSDLSNIKIQDGSMFINNIQYEILNDVSVAETDGHYDWENDRYIIDDNSGVRISYRKSNTEFDKVYLEMDDFDFDRDVTIEDLWTYFIDDLLYFGIILPDDIQSLKRSLSKI